MISLNGHRKTKYQLSDYLPWAMLVNESTIMQKDGIFQSSFQVEGHNFFSATNSNIESITAAANNLFMYCEKGWAVFVEAQRSLCSDYPQSCFSIDILEDIDNERKDIYASKALFRMQYYLTFCYQQEEREKKVSKFFAMGDESGLNEEAEAFYKKIRDIEGMLKACFKHVDLLKGTHLLSYLHNCVSHEVQKVLVPPITMYIDSYLSNRAISLDDSLTLGGEYLGILSIHDFPHATRPELLEELQYLELEFRWQTRMIFLDEAQSLQEIKKYRRKHYSKRKGMLKAVQEKHSGEEGLENTESIMRALDADDALKLVGKGNVRFGYITSVVVLSDTSMSRLREKIAKVKEVFHKKGFIVKEEQLNAMDAWLSSIPGQVYCNVRRSLIHSVNLAHILPLSAKWKGEKFNRHMEKVCGLASSHMLVRSQNNAFHLNLNQGDVGHSFIVGPTGAGKSTLLGALSAQFMRYPFAKVIIFDKDFSALPLTQKLGGRYYAPGSEQSSIRFQPYKLIDNPNEENWAIQYTSTLVQLNGLQISRDLLHEIKRGIALLKQIPEHKRNLSSLHRIVQDQGLKHSLEKYCGDTHYGAIFDGIESSVVDTAWVMFEMGYLMKLGEDAVIPAIEYLFHKVEAAFDGNPVLLVLDEGWLFLQHPSFAEQFKVWLKTLRKKNVFVVMATQEIADAIKSPLLETIMSACQTRIFLPDKSAGQSQIRKLYSSVGLNEREIEIIANALPKREYYLSSHAGTALFELDLSDRFLNLLSK